MMEFRDLLKRREYDFINKDSKFKENILFLNLAGSISYGTNNHDSDIDLRGVMLESKRDILGFGCFEQYEDENTDTVIYGLRKFVKLCLNANPNVLELLGTRDEHVVYMTPLGKIIRENYEIFLSKRVFESFGNYALAQLRRLENAIARDRVPQEKKEEHILNSINSQMSKIKSNFHEFGDGDIRLYMDKSCKEGLNSEIYMDISLRGYPLRDFTSIYSSMDNVLKSYSKLTHRNNKKDDLHLNKHAMHLIRLLIMGKEILKGLGINTYREEDRELLFKIRNGKYSYEEIFKLVDEHERQFKMAYDETKLPDEPDYKKAEELVMEIYERTFLIK